MLISYYKTHPRFSTAKAKKNGYVEGVHIALAGGHRAADFSNIALVI